MDLSSDLISQFVKATKTEKQTNNETTVYGTVVYDGRPYVKIDGSDLLTPVSSTTNILDGERVMVRIKSHVATVIGNLSSPSARTDEVDDLGTKIDEFDIVIADKVNTKQLEAQIARIDSLVAEDVTIRGELTAASADIGKLKAEDAEISGKLTAHEAEIGKLSTDKLDATMAEIKYATIDNLNATNATINNLNATHGEFVNLTTDRFTAIDGSIQNLETNKLDADSADIRYATIDFANIGEAAVERLLSDFGLIKDLTFSSGTVTGELNGVTINGDLINANTLKADRLVVKGEDGLYYQLNVKAGGNETVTEQFTEEELQNGLLGTNIIAKSITAEKVAVDDLVAFDATIGGFNITTDALYSGVKSTVDNTTPGVYMDDEGQMSIGDDTNYLKYYKDADGTYKLAVSAESIVFGVGSKNLETAFEDVDTSINDSVGSLRDDLDDAIKKIATYLTNGSVETLMTQTEEGWGFNIQELSSVIGDHGRTLEYVKITTYNDQPCIELGESDSDYKLLITNENIMFKAGSNTPTHINTNGLVTQDIEVEGDIKQGGYTMMNTSDGGWGLLWTGGNS